jgi:hypothetical protein
MSFLAPRPGANSFFLGAKCTIRQKVLALGSCSGITAQYEGVRRVVCPSDGSDGNDLATGENLGISCSGFESQFRRKGEPIPRSAQKLRLMFM